MQVATKTIFLVVSTLMFSQACAGDEPQLTAADVQFFETKIRPALVKHCYECHSAGSKEVGGKLLLDSRDGLLQGGEAGTVFVAGQPDESLLMQALRYDGIQMPPEEPLPEAVINDFAEWITRGAPDPRTTEAMAKEAAAHDAEALWAFEPAKNPPIPDVKNNAWLRDSLDNFVLAKIEAAGLTPNQDAAPRTLVRRLFIDLTGLPPSFEDIDEFVTAYEQHGEKATEELVDQLLASPQYGERWGRHWLDVARYGESNGNDGLGRNPTFPHAWRYRDYVIEAFNSDTPYDRFLIEQIAGDLLPAETDAEHDRHVIATGFLAMAAKPAKAMNDNFDMDVVADQIDVIGSGVIGISVACARCHDHKFDPVPTRDYYAIAGIFTSSETMWGSAANEGLTAPKTDLHVLKAAAHVPPPKDFVETVLVLESNTGISKPIPKSKWPVGTPLAMGVRDSEKPADCKLNIKGEAKKLGAAVPRGFLTACRFESADIPAINPQQSGRLELAQWLTRGDHPLTARVMVNRIWQHLFGEGIVRTPNDFGVYGERPTHPELLDHLAIRFVSERWSMKTMIRNIVLSRTYQLSSDTDETLLKADAANALLTRHVRRRMDAETLRDSILKASGQLDLTPADGSIVRHRDILVNLAGNLHEPSHHRSVYLCYLRSSPPPELAAFDLPDFTAVIGKRDVSTVPNQALHLYNNPFVIEQSQHLAAVVTKTEVDNNDRIRLAWQRALGRNATPEELQQADEFLRLTQNELGSEERAWASLCQALLITNEFRYVD
ncbi:MAG: PSD1 domain-containing protein [Planctomycetaceae bacterium]|nr:PSD1 domain-containing protein [Planctomycetaceae bacterium]